MEHISLKPSQELFYRNNMLKLIMINLTSKLMVDEVRVLIADTTRDRALKLGYAGIRAAKFFCLTFAVLSIGFVFFLLTYNEFESQAIIIVIPLRPSTSVTYIHVVNFALTKNSFLT